MKLTDFFFEQSKDIWQAYLQHPFIKELGQGTLPPEKFEYYLIQDYLYLREYTKVFAAGMIKAETMKDMKFFYRGVGGILEDETAVHINYLRGFGHDIDRLELHETNLVTDSYTSYMHSICLKGDVKEILATLLPCVWSYHFISQFLLQNSGQHFYREWIEAYGGDEYTQTSNEWIDYTNEFCENISLKEKEKLSLIFKKSSLYELKFWDMAYSHKYSKVENR